MKRQILALALAVTLVPAFALAGGHATIRVAEMPKRMIAGQVVVVDFTIHDAVGNPISTLRPTLIATQGRRRVEVAAAAAPKKEGAYQAAVRFPASGEWTLTVDSKYCGNTNVMRGVQVLAAR